MSKITNDGLTRSGTKCTYMATVVVKGLKRPKMATDTAQAPQEQETVQVT